MGLILSKGGAPKPFINPVEGFDAGKRAAEVAQQLVNDLVVKAQGGRSATQISTQGGRSLALPKRKSPVKDMRNPEISPQLRIQQDAANAARVAMEALKQSRDGKDVAQPLTRMIDPNGDGRYITEADKINLRQMEAFGPQSYAHLAVARGTSVAYMRRRCVILEKLGLIEKQVHPLWKTTYNLTDVGIDQFIDSQFVPRLKLTRPTSFNGDHMKQSNINTIVAKLLVGADEQILFDEDETSRHHPVAVLSKSWIDGSAMANSAKAKRAVYEDARAQVEDMVSMDAKHPVRKARFKRNATLHGSTTPTDNASLMKIYQQMHSAWIFSTHDSAAGSFTRDLNPDFVVLRPIVIITGEGGWDFDNDACYCLTMPLSADEYMARILAVYATGMYGRIQFFRSPNKRIADDVIADAWNKIVRDKILGPDLIPFGEPGCFVRIRDFPEPVNHTGRGDDRLNDRGERLARTRFDG